MKVNGDSLRAIRLGQQLSITQLSRASGVDRTVITRIEDGARRGTLEQLAALADALNVPKRAITWPEASDYGRVA